jgi:hypothetical protein
MNALGQPAMSGLSDVVQVCARVSVWRRHQHRERCLGSDQDISASAKHHFISFNPLE